MLLDGETSTKLQDRKVELNTPILKPPAGTADETLHLSEIFSALWASKHAIVISSIVGLLLSFLYINVSTPYFSAVSMVALKNSDRTRIGVPDGVAAFMGLKDSSSEQVADRILGRDFIVEISNALSLDGDPYFNSNLVDEENRGKTIRDFLIRALGAEERRSDLETETPAEDHVVHNFRESVEVDLTPGDTVTISVIHPEADSAAVVANAIAQLLLQKIKDDAQAAYLDGQEYLVELLNKAREDVERTKRAIADFDRSRGNEFSMFQLQSDARIAETVYNTLVENVQAQMVFAGYSGETGIVFQTATPSINPKYPNKVLAHAAGVIGGGVLGTLGSFLRILLTGTIFTCTSISAALRARRNLSAPNTRTRFTHTKSIVAQLSRSSSPWVSEAVWAIQSQPSNIVVVAPSSEKISPGFISIRVGAALSADGRRVAVLLFDRTFRKPTVMDDSSNYFGGEFVRSLVAGTTDIFERAPGLHAGAIDQSVPALSFREAVNASLAKYDYIVVGATSATYAALTLALGEMNCVSVAVTQPGLTNFAEIRKLRDVISPEINICAH